MSKFTKIATSAVVTASVLAIPMSAAASFYPANRPTYTCLAAQPDGTVPCPGADHVVFDSFTNNPTVGDERPFFAGSLNGANVQDRIQVKDGDVITLRAYVHNNADATKMGGEDKTVAKDVSIKVLVPTASQKDTNLIAFISASNANPKVINDTMSLYADSPFTVSYIPGTAQFSHAADGVHQTTVALSDNIVKDGASLGNINGCFAYSGWVTLKVKVSIPSTPKPPVAPPVTPPVTPTTPTTPTALPNTGAGNVIGIVAGAMVAGFIASRLFLSRKLARKA